MFVTILLLTCGAEPQFQVENKTTPSFEVVNRTTLAATENAYQRVYARVLAGERVEFKAPLEGFPGEAGTYIGWMQGGQPRFERKVVKPVAAAGKSSDPSPESPSTRGTAAPTRTAYSSPIGVREPGSSGVTSGNSTSTFAPNAARLGGTDCPLGQP